jgi:hypothetical protein
MALARIYSAAEAPSRRQLAGDSRALIHASAAQIRYLSLHGYLAVDGVEYVVRQMLALAAETRSFILDMNQVTGLSESGAKLLNQVRMGLADEGVAVVFSRINGRRAIVDPLSRALPGGGQGFLSFEDNDLAVEWCENRLLTDAGLDDQAVGAVDDAPLFAGLDEALLARVMAITRVERYAKGEQILVAGQADDTRIFFIESGSVSILIPLNKGGHQRVVTLGAGMNFGEMILLGGTTRSASAFADTGVSCRVLDATELDALAGRYPQIKICVLENLARDLVQKVRRSTQWISALA